MYPAGGATPPLFYGCQQRLKTGALIP